MGYGTSLARFAEAARYRDRCVSVNAGSAGKWPSFGSCAPARPSPKGHMREWGDHHAIFGAKTSRPEAIRWPGPNFESILQEIRVESARFTRLPLREKARVEDRSDEGSISPLRSCGHTSWRGRRAPSSAPAPRGHLLPQRKKGSARLSAARRGPCRWRQRPRRWPPCRPPAPASSGPHNRAAAARCCRYRRPAGP